jgi:hypothetical protein
MRAHHVFVHRSLRAAASLVLLVRALDGRASVDAANAVHGGLDGQAAAVQPTDGRSAQTALPSVSKRIEAELVLEPRTAAPGAAIKLRYMISSYEDTDTRVRMRIEAGPGWMLLDTDNERRELLLEKWENIEGELYVLLPDDARVGERQLVRLLVELVGEPGVIQAQDYVSVGRRGGVKSGGPVMAATVTVGLSRLGGGMDQAQQATAVSMSTKFRRDSTFSMFYDRGLRENLSNFRFEEQRTRLSGNLRHAGWDVTFGNYVSSSAHTLAGPYVLGRGVSVGRPVGRLLVELTASQPNTIGGEAGGHLLRGRIGVRTPRLSLAFLGSDFGRPVGGYTTLARVQQTLVSVDTEERIEIERRLTANAA